MLELDLDLEADLGIDTVKQVAILADARQHFGLEQESGFRVRDYHTLRKVITYFQTRLTEGKKPSFFRIMPSNPELESKKWLAAYKPTTHRLRSDFTETIRAMNQRAASQLQYAGVQEGSRAFF
ncbi:hypothetical protein GCM10020331_058710 [Ectobacillus funiculus]